MRNQVTLTEAAELLSVPIGTLNSWCGRKQVYPTGRARNPATNRYVRVYDLDELKQLAVRQPTPEENP